MPIHGAKAWLESMPDGASGPEYSRNHLILNIKNLMARKMLLSARPVSSAAQRWVEKGSDHQVASQGS
jgi:hypothetical protein